ncbi:hypothetical protein D1007_51729 [Hordeum vulgare]|nr:hypothetical protein D1007_51729 [Hordeum vulgare]
MAGQRLAARAYLATTTAGQRLAACSGMEQDDSPVYAQQVSHVERAPPATPPISINHNSHVILIPVHLVNHYALYAFDIENKKTSILDSLGALGPFNESRMARHQKTCHAIAYHLDECMRFTFPGWDEDISSWDIKVVENIPEQQNSTGMASV